MGVLKVMDTKKGHVETPFSVSDHKEASEAFDNAMGGFARFRAYNVITHGGKREAEPTSTFDPSAIVTIEKGDKKIEKQVEEVLLVPPLAGGA